jgi:hypothetical protein
MVGSAAPYEDVWRKTLQRILRLLAPLTLLLAATALVACGGGDSGTSGKKLSSTSDPQKILDDTFSGGKTVESGRFDLKMTINATGGGSTLNGPVDITLGGPFQSQGKAKVPKFDIDLEFKGAGQDIKAGATSTGEKGFLSFNGTDYSVPDDVFKQFSQGYTQAQDQNKSQGGTLKELGITPQDWLKDPQVDDSSSVEGTDTVKVTGGIDVPKMLDDVSTLLSKAGSLGIPNTGQIPSQLTDDQKAQVEKAIQSADVTIESGKDDSILRRMAFTLAIQDPTGSGGKADIDFDLTLSDLGADQEISEPSNTKPLNDLLSQFGGLGALGGLGGSSSSSSGGGASADAAQKYSDCVKAAGSDQSKLQDCADLLGG